MVGEPRRRVPPLIERRAVIPPDRHPDRRSRFTFEGHLEGGEVRGLEPKPIASDSHPHQSEAGVPALAQKHAVLAHDHPPTIEFEPGRADNRLIDLDPTARLHRVDEEPADRDHLGSSPSAPLPGFFVSVMAVHCTGLGI